MPIEHISAVTFAVHDMARSVGFYQKLGFTLVKDGSAEFTSLRAGDAFVNLATARDYQRGWWGRVIFRVDDADAHYRILVAAGLRPDSPQDAPWGERFFHITDPDGHELSFAQQLIQ